MEKIWFELQSVPQYFETFQCFTKFLFTTKEMMGDYYLKTWYVRVASRRILGNQEIPEKCLNPIERLPSAHPPSKMEILLILAENH